MRRLLSWIITALALVGLVIPEPSQARGAGGSRSSGKSSTYKSSSHTTSSKRAGHSGTVKSSAFKTARYNSVSSDRTYKAPPPRTPRAWSAGGTRNISGPVRVHDGDTFYAEGKRIRVRGIDTPELGQPRSFAARDRLNQLLHSGSVTVEPRAIDKYGRTVAIVKVNGQDVAGILKAEGFAKPR